MNQIHLLIIQLRHCLWKCWYCMKRSQECGQNGCGCTRLAVRFYAYSTSVLREQQPCNLSTSPSLPPSSPLGMLGRTDLISCHETYAVRPPSHSGGIAQRFAGVVPGSRAVICIMLLLSRFVMPSLPFSGPRSVPQTPPPSKSPRLPYPLPFAPSKVAFLVVTLSSILQPSDAGLSIDFASNSLI